MAMGVVPALRPIRGASYRHAPGMITCRQFEDFLDDYLDGTLSARRRVAFELHADVPEDLVNAVMDALTK